MKISDNHFESYINKYEQCSLHPKLQEVYNLFPESLNDMNNIIFYGPSGTGKYTQMLACIKKYSNSNLKYEKKISITFNKNTYYYKISDVHFEIDMSLLGCNSKLLWNEIYKNIQDIILTKSNNGGIIVCKNFHEIHSELLDIFYSYMFTLTNVNIKYIILTEKVSLIPDNIINTCQIISVPRPSKTLYNKCINNKLNKKQKLSQIDNIKYINITVDKYTKICNNIIDIILNVDNNIYIELRDKIYDIFIYNLDVTECVWYIIKHLIENKHVKENDINDILLTSFKFFQFYNNNYRPIYHLENFVFYLINKIYEF
tara:strand:+ start:4929 stop:5873 length:945 start_codon:yes stop_codon:yes gene_type:complete